MFDRRTFERRIRRILHRVTLAKPLAKIYDRISHSKNSKMTLGQRGEREAERFCLREGMIVIERGYSDLFGEIDLIVADADAIVFIEVKTRSSDYAGAPTEAVDERKQQRITKTAQGFLKLHRLTEHRVRFDVISLIWPDLNASPEIKHYRSAFEAYGEFQMY